MNTKQEVVEIAGLHIEVLRKDIKNTHLTVYPPTGRLRVSTPLRTSSEMLRLFLLTKLGWIKRHIRQFEEQERESPREYLPGESHYYAGRRYLLNIIEQQGRHRIDFKNHKELNLYISPGADAQQRARLLQQWYRRQLRAQIPPLLEKWQKKLGVKAAHWGIKHMRTKWGSCNPAARRIWLNLELAKKPKACLEYILVHELVHLLEPTHNERFVALMDQYLPAWRSHRDLLNSLPLAHHDWSY